jgi:hypothetical protein
VEVYKIAKMYIEYVDNISKNLQEGRQTDILIMNFAKAFDKVNHSLLIHKLRYYGIAFIWMELHTPFIFPLAELIEVFLKC